MMTAQFLSDGQIQQFIETGYLVIRDGIPRDFADRWAQRAFDRLGYDRNDPTSWTRERTHLSVRETVDVAELAPDVWAATCDLLGGEDRVKPFNLGDGFIANLGRPDITAWEPPSHTRGNWHKDGDFFRHFLDSPEQGLLTICLWTSVEHQGGATFISPDSVGVVARRLAEVPQGLLPDEFNYGDLIQQCHDFVELTGDPGDVILHHPYMLHTASPNFKRVERVITNPPVQLRDPMNFNRPNADDFSPVERCVLRGLGVDRLDFQPTGQRERIVPERIKRQQQLLAEERQRESAGAG